MKIELLGSGWQKILLNGDAHPDDYRDHGDARRINQFDLLLRKRQSVHDFLVAWIPHFGKFNLSMNSLNSALRGLFMKPGFFSIYALMIISLASSSLPMA